MEPRRLVVAERANDGGAEACRRGNRAAPLLLLRGLCAAALVSASSGACSRGAVPQPPCANCDWGEASPCGTATVVGIASGDHCTAQCQIGFTSAVAQSETYTCNGQQLAPTAGQPVLNCLAAPPSRDQRCPATPPCEADGCEWDSACRNPGKGQATSACTAVCRPGWYSADVDNPSRVYTYSCKNGASDWKASHHLMCQKYCPNVPPQPNQVWRSGGNEDYDCAEENHIHQTEDFAPNVDRGNYWCKSQCETGYEWRITTGDLRFCEDDSDSEEGRNDKDIGWYKCRADGSWQTETHPECTCKATSCPTQVVTHPGDETVGWTGTECEEGRFGDHGCEIDCKAGYVQVGGSGHYTCGADKLWHHEPGPLGAAGLLECQPKACPTDVVAHVGDETGGWTGTECAEGHFGDHGCEIRCKSGYWKAGGSGHYTCDSTGAWYREPSSGPLECKRECAASLLVTHSESHACAIYNQEALTRDNRSLPVSGETCNGVCTSGYVESNPGSFTCADNGHWVRDGGGAATFACVLPEHAQQCLSDDHFQDETYFPGCDPGNRGVCTCNLTGSRDTGCEAHCAEGTQPNCRKTTLTNEATNKDECDPHFICDAQGRWVPKIPSKGLVCVSKPTFCPAGRALFTDPFTSQVKCTVCQYKAGDSRPECQTASKAWWFLLLLWIPASYAFAYIICPGYLPGCLAPRRPGSKPSVLRETFLGDMPLPGAQLAEQDVASRWMVAEQLRHQDAGDSDDEGSTLQERHTAPGALGVGSGEGLFRSFSSGRRRHKANGSRPLSVMFTGDHVGELQPWDWQVEVNALGTGSYGIVYKAQWRGRDVAVKVLKLPQRVSVLTTSGQAKLKAQVESVMQDFIDEVEVCCDLNHPNLARLLGYAENPTLMMVQELLYNSCDHLLYVEHWQPTTADVLKAALDVAKGMAYLHTSFSMPDSHHTQPIIHRDLKTPNLLLASNPCAPGGTVMMKITDFGLSRDKGMGDSFNSMQTVAMTGCGSVLWMAPEILTGETYNEKVDVFSFAMCLVELVGCTLPWRGLCPGGPAEVPHRVTRGERPDAQLNSLNRGGAVGLGLKQLIDECWHHYADQRPAFPEVVTRLRDLRRMEAGGGAAGAGWTTAGGVAAADEEQPVEDDDGSTGGVAGGSGSTPPSRKKKKPTPGALPDLPELGGAE